MRVLLKNLLHVMVRRKENFNIDGYDFEINMRNLESGKWNGINKHIKLPKRSKKEEFIVPVANYGKYSFQLDKIQILKKR